MRDDFSIEVRRVLAARVNHRCSNPSCGSQTSGPQTNPAKALNIGVGAHITAASPGGPDYDANITRQERAASSNGIWLCQNCAKLIDNDRRRFTPTLLRHWKQVAEKHAGATIGRQSPFDRGSAPKIVVSEFTNARTQIRYPDASKAKLRNDLRSLFAIEINSNQFEVLAEGTLFAAPCAVVACGAKQGWDWTVVVASASEMGWKRFAEVPLPNQKGRVPRATYVLGSPPVLVLTYLEGSGTGVLREATSWYRLTAGELQPFLTIPSYFHVFGWGMPFNRRLTSRVKTMPKALCGGAILELEFTVEYTIGEAFLDEATESSLFSIEKLIALEWNQRESAFVPLTPVDDLADIEEIWSESTDAFVKRNRATLEDLAANGIPEQSRFVKERLLPLIYTSSPKRSS